MKKYLVGVFVLVFVVGLILFQYSGVSESGVERVFEKTSVAPGEVIEVKLHINLGNDETYYIVEEIVPEGFVVLDDAARNNAIRLVKIQDAESNVFSYKIEAPAEKGVYVFSGEYGMELIDGTRAIEGVDRISVE